MGPEHLSRLYGLREGAWVPLQEPRETTGGFKLEE